MKRFPTYSELIATCDMNLTEAAAIMEMHRRRLERKARWNRIRQKVLCFFGLHPWETVKAGRCKAYIGTVFTGPKIQIPVRWVIEQCPHCHTKRGVITDGIHRQAIDPDYILQELS